MPWVKMPRKRKALPTPVRKRRSTLLGGDSAPIDLTSVDSSPSSKQRDEHNLYRPQIDMVKEVANYRAILERGLLDLDLLVEKQRYSPLNANALCQIMQNHKYSVFEAEYTLSRTLGDETMNNLAANKVGNIPEIVEMILGNLDPTELLGTQSVNRTFRNLINGSKFLQHKAFLLPGFEYQPLTREHDMFDPKGPGYNLEENVVYGPSEAPSFDIKLEVYIRYSPNLRVGSRWREMLICQPPIFEMNTFVNCSDVVPYFVATTACNCGTITLKNPAGLRFGDLLDHGEALRQMHRTCPKLTASAHNPDGSVNVTVHFNCSISLADADPMMRTLPQLWAIEKRKYDEEEASKSLITKYSKAMRKLQERGQPIISLALFKEQQESLTKHGNDEGPPQKKIKTTE